MGRAKEIIVKVIPSSIANVFVKKNHYSGKVVPNSTLHFGCFLDGDLHGVMSYGNPMDKRKVLPMVKNTNWNEMLERQYITYVDNSEIQSYVVAMDDNDLKKRKNDLFEICPSMMLGVMASGIPFPDHNQVRINFYNTYIYYFKF